MFGTDDKYRAYRARMKAAKDAMPKGASKEDWIKTERKMQAEAEAAGIRSEAEVLKAAS